MRPLQWALYAAVAVQIGCNFVPTKPCTSNEDCGSDEAYCDDGTKTCVLYQCSEACENFEQCVRGTCQARYSELEILNPVHDGRAGKSTTIQARLNLTPGRLPSDPAPALKFEVSETDGSAPAGGGNLTPKDDVYEATWVPEKHGISYRVTVSYPGTGLSDTVTVMADKNSPVFEVVVPDSSHAGIYADAAMPGAYKRHEAPAAYVRSADSDVDASSIRWELTGFNGTTYTGVALSGGATQVTDPADAACSGVSFCARFTPELWRPELRAMRGRFEVSASGRDAAGNVADSVARAEIKISRLRWARNVGGVISGTPAIGKHGRVYVGTQGKQLLGINSAGIEEWTVTQGAIYGSPAVGAHDGADEWVYAAVEDDSGNGRIIAVRGSNGGSLVSCSNLAGRSYSGIAITSTPLLTGLHVESASAVINETDGQLQTLRPGAPAGGPRCRETLLSTTTSSDGTLVARGDELFLGDVTGSVRRLSFNAATQEFSATWADVPVRDVSDAPIEGLAVASDEALLLAGSSAGVAGVGLSTGADEWSFPSASAPATFAPVVSPGPNALFGANGPLFFSVPLRAVAGTPVSSSGGLPVKSAPLVGKDGLIYTVNAEGWLDVWQSSPGLERVWRGQLATGITAVGSPAIDCRRRGESPIEGPGVMYVGASNSVLYSIDVDSGGLDSSAPWPKLQHDPANTGNALTPIPVCP